jgi:hypothetical protein
MKRLPKLFVVKINMRAIFHSIIWPILLSVVLLAIEDKLIGTWHYEDFVGPAHTLWFLGMWLLGIVPFLIILAAMHLLKRVFRSPT